MQKGALTETGARFSDRNLIAANLFSVARVTCNMHDALLIEQRRTNQLLETLIELGGGDVPDVEPAVLVEHHSLDPMTGEPVRDRA